jgi:hypothetical protein
VYEGREENEPIRCALRHIEQISANEVERRFAMIPFLITPGEPMLSDQPG